jgi:beta-lactamase class D
MRLMKRVQRRMLVCLCLTIANVAPSAVRAQAGEDGAIEFLPARAAIDATGFDGCVLVYDLERDAHTAGHAERLDRRLIPASTFKIFSALVALETGVIDGPDSVIPWDGVVRERAEVNEDLSLQSAFRLSAVPHFQDLVRRIGHARMQAFVDAVGYGNGDLSGEVDGFWLRGGLRISPREQVAFLVRLYQGELPFSARSMAMVKQMMVTEETPEQTLRAKTGWATLAEDRHTGWWVGWVEHESGVHVFATVLEAVAPDSTFGPARLSVTRTVLGDLGVLAR